MPDRGAQRTGGARGVITREQQRPTRRRRHGRQQFGVACLRALVELVARGRRFVERAGGHEDLDGGGEDRGAVRIGAGLVQHPDSRRCGGVEPALREPQQGESGDGIATVAARGAVRGLGLVQVPPHAMKLTLLVQGVAERGVLRLGEVRPSPVGFRARLLPRAAGHQHLRSVHEALAAVRHHRRVGPHQADSASVHAAARRRSRACMHASMTAQ